MFELHQCLKIVIYMNMFFDLIRMYDALQPFQAFGIGTLSEDTFIPALIRLMFTYVSASSIEQL